MAIGCPVYGFAGQYGNSRPTAPVAETSLAAGAVPLKSMPVLLDVALDDAGAQLRRLVSRGRDVALGRALVLQPVRRGPGHDDMTGREASAEGVALPVRRDAVGVGAARQAGRHGPAGPGIDRPDRRGEAAALLDGGGGRVHEAVLRGVVVHVDLEQPDALLHPRVARERPGDGRGRADHGDAGEREKDGRNETAHDSPPGRPRRRTQCVPGGGGGQPARNRSSRTSSRVSRSCHLARPSGSRCQRS